MKLAVCHVAGVVWPLSLAAKHLNYPWVTAAAFFVSSLLTLLVNVMLQPNWTEFATLSLLCQMHPLGVSAPAFALHPASAMLLALHLAQRHPSPLLTWSVDHGSLICHSTIDACVTIVQLHCHPSCWMGHPHMGKGTVFYSISNTNQLTT